MRQQIRRRENGPLHWTPLDKKKRMREKKNGKGWRVQWGAGGSLGELAENTGVAVKCSPFITSFSDAAKKRKAAQGIPGRHGEKKKKKEEKKTPRRGFV